MGKKFFTLAMLLGAATLGMNAQDHVYLIKGNKVVAKYPVGSVDYMSFKLPEGVSETSVEVEAVETGKNYLTYSVKTADADQYYGHGFFQAQLLDVMLRKYYDTNIKDVEEGTLKQLIKSLLANYGYMDKGNNVFTIKDGDNDGYGTDFFIPGGQDFYVATVNITEVTSEGGTMGDDISITKMTTQAPGNSNETMGIEYTGLNAEGKATYNITPGDGIKTMYTLLAKKSQLDEYTTLYGYDYVIFSLAMPITASDWKEYGSQMSWELDDENDYVMSVLGIDKNGDWVKASDEQHIITTTDKCPKVNVFSKEAGEGKVKVNFEITPSNVSAAHVRLMPDNDVVDELNNNKTLDQIAIEDGAIDIKNDINTAGEYTFAKNDIERGWYSLLISAIDENGTNVTRLIFHTHLENFTWETETTTFPVTANEAKTKSQLNPSKGIAGEKNIATVNPTEFKNTMNLKSFKTK